MLRVNRGSPDHFVQCLIGEASVGMNCIGVPSQCLEEALVVLRMDVGKRPERDSRSTSC